MKKSGSSINRETSPGVITYALIERSLKERFQMGDPVVGPLGEDRGHFQFLVTYGEGESKYKYKRILLPKAAVEFSTRSVKSPNLSDKGS